MGELRIYSHTHPLQAAKTIAGMIHRHKHAEIQATSHPAIYQAVKTMAYAAALLKEEGIYVGFTATYIPKGTEGNTKKGFRFFIAPLSLAGRVPPQTPAQSNRDRPRAVGPLRKGMENDQDR